MHYNGSDVRDQVLVIACGALAHEILALKSINRLDHISLYCLPAELHNRPEKITPLVKEAIFKGRKKFKNIVVGYGECGTKGQLDKLLQEEKIDRISGPHCYAFFSGLEKFGDPSEEDMDVFYLTDFLARHFEKLVYEALGLTDHPELIDEYFKHYNRLVYLAQRNDEDLVDRAKKAARLLRLKFEIRPTGYGDLEPFISKL